MDFTSRPSVTDWQITAWDWLFLGQDFKPS